jgi:hypothetical protein
MGAPVHDWNKVVNALQNDNNANDNVDDTDDAILFMERLWALLLSPRIPEIDQLSLLRQDFAGSQGYYLHEGMVSMKRK